MPALTGGQLTKLRTHPHSVSMYLAVYEETVVFSASITNATFDNITASVTYDTVTVGSYTDILIGMTVKITSSAGAFKGYGRVRKSPIDGTVYLGHTSPGEIEFVTGDLIKVLDEYRPYVKVPRIKAKQKLMYKDYDKEFAVTDGEDLRPVCVPGPDACGFVDGSGNHDVDFDLTNSYAMANGATIVDYSADLGSGTVISGTVASGIFTARFSNGSRWVYLSCEDSNGQVHTAQRLVHSFEKDIHDPVPVRNVNLSTSLEGGWTMTAEIAAADASPAAIPEMSRVVLFVEENYGSSSGSITGFAGRENVKFVGYIDKEGITIEPDSDSFTITALGPLALMDNMTSFTQTVVRKASPTKWHHMKDFDAYKFVWYLMFWHSNMYDLFDTEKPSWWSDYPVPGRLDGEPGSLSTQLNFAVNAVGAFITSDYQGRIYFRKYPNVHGTTFRNTVDEIITLTDADLIDVIQIDRVYRTPVYWLRSAAFIAGTSTEQAIMSIAPGKAPGQGSQETMKNQQLVVDQDELNERTGFAYALEKGKLRSVRVTLAHTGWIADPALQEWVVLTLDSTSNKREVSFSADRFLVREMSIDYDQETGVLTEGLVLEPEIFGAAGTVVKVPVNTMETNFVQPPPPTIPVFSSIVTPPVITPTNSLAFTAAPAVFALGDNASATHLMRTLTHTAGSPEWEILVNTSRFGGDSQMLSFCVDSWNPREAIYALVYDFDTDLFNVWYIENIMGDAGTQTLTLLNSQVSTMGSAAATNKYYTMIVSSINVDGAIFYAFSNDTLYANAIRRASRTASFQSVSVGGRPIAHPSIAISHVADGSTGIVITGFAKIESRSDDFGASFYTNRDWGGTENATYSVIFPYNFNLVGGDIYYYTVENYGVIKNFPGVGDVSITPLSSLGFNAYPHRMWNGFHTYTLDNSYLAMTAELNPTSGDHQTRLFYSTNEGTNWTERTSGIVSARGLGGWPYDPNILFFYGDGTVSGVPGIWWTDDAGLTYNNMIGDWVAVTGQSYTGLVQLVPIWVP